MNHSFDIDNNPVIDTAIDTIDTSFDEVDYNLHLMNNAIVDASGNLIYAF